MPDLAQHQSAQTTKVLVLGDSGGGKTGALASLAASGYNLRIIDVDNGLDVLANLLTDPSSEYLKRDPKALERVKYETLTDSMKASGGSIRPAKATVWQRAVKLLEDWPGLGSVTTWTPQDVLVIDSLTMLSTAALNFILALNGRLGGHPQLQDWGAGQTLIESFVQALYDESVRCNVVMNCHIKYVGEENGPARGYPNTLGQALPPKIGRYFNSILLVRSVGQGTKLSRKVLTSPTGLIELKNTAPLKVQAEYDLAWGLADYFAAVRQTTQETVPTNIARIK
jgi:hypothetical protein